MEGRWLFLVPGCCPEVKPTFHDGDMVPPQGMMNMVLWEKPPGHTVFWWISFSGSSWCSRWLAPTVVLQQDYIFCAANIVPWGPADPTGVWPSAPCRSGPHSCHELSCNVHIAISNCSAAAGEEGGFSSFSPGSKGLSKRCWLSSHLGWQCCFQQSPNNWHPRPKNSTGDIRQVASSLGVVRRLMLVRAAQKQHACPIACA